MKIIAITLLLVITALVIGVGIVIGFYIGEAATQVAICAVGNR